MVPTPRRMPVRPAPDDDAVAWELAAVAHPHLSRADADHVYIAIGIGEVFEAIDALLTVIARDHIPIDAELVATVSTWLDCYRGQAAAARLRQLLTEIEHAAPQPMSAFAGPVDSAEEYRHRRSG